MYELYKTPKMPQYNSVRDKYKVQYNTFKDDANRDYIPKITKEVEVAATPGITTSTASSTAKGAKPLSDIYAKSVKSIGSNWFKLSKSQANRLTNDLVKTINAAASISGKGDAVKNIKTSYDSTNKTITFSDSVNGRSYEIVLTESGVGDLETQMNNILRDYLPSNEKGTKTVTTQGGEGELDD